MTQARDLLSRRRFLQVASAGVLGLGAVSWHSLLFSPTNPVVSYQEVALRDLPAPFDGMRVVQISDLHFSRLVPREYLEKCVKAVNALEPDLLFLTGDYITHDSEVGRPETLRRFIAPLPEILGPLEAKYGRFAVLGNHDVTVNPRAVEGALEEAGIQVLRNERLALTRQGTRLPIVGLADSGTEYSNQNLAFRGIPTTEPSLIMMHNPDLFGDGMRHENGVVFAGHTHGGQVDLPIFGPIYVPSRYGDRFLSGRFQQGDLTMLVNRGLGVIRYRIRLNCRPEISVVTLRTA